VSKTNALKLGLAKMLVSNNQNYRLAQKKKCPPANCQIKKKLSLWAGTVRTKGSLS